MLAALAATPTTDPTSVAEALAELRRVEALPPGPVDEALALADAWTALAGEAGEGATAPCRADVARARPRSRRSRRRRLEHTRPHEIARLADLRPRTLGAIEAAHAAVVDAAEKSRTPRPRPLVRRRLEAARAAEQQLLDQLGLSSYHADPLRVAPGLSVPIKQERLERANAALADAEAVWEELHAPAADDRQAQELAAETNRVRTAAVDLIGDDPGADVDGALRALRRPADAEPARLELLAALEAVGASAGPRCRSRGLGVGMAGVRRRGPRAGPRCRPSSAACSPTSTRLAADDGPPDEPARAGLGRTHRVERERAGVGRAWRRSSTRPGPRSRRPPVTRRRPGEPATRPQAGSRTLARRSSASSRSARS